MINAISQLPPPERDHLIHALEALEKRQPMAQLLLGFLLVEKSKAVRQGCGPGETHTAQLSRSHELAQLSIETLRGLSQKLVHLWEKDLYFHSLISANTYTGALAGRSDSWLTQLGDQLGELPWAARTLCLAYSDRWHGSSQLCLSLARKIFDAAEPGSPASGIIVYAYDLIFYHKRFVEAQAIDPPSYFSQADIKDEILKSLKKWYAVKERIYGFQRSTVNDHIISTLLFLGYPKDTLKALLKSHPADAIWCIRKMIQRSGLHNHLLKAISDNEQAPQLHFLR